ncbi:MAG TPA: SDR family NAD(P)-dependent oxidoreductase [bacterium]|nr:SDR family NAD(P)-dependent oxidoreductase [bacterium]
MSDPRTAFQGKVALVTGASIGIGRATALALAREGADVALGYHQDAAGAEETRSQVETLGRRAAVVQADVSVPAQVDAMVAAVQKALGPVDVLINNAGGPKPQELDAITLEDWERVMAVNLTSVFLVTRACLPHMRQQRWGRIVNVSSGAARTGGIMGLHYSAAKAGVEGLTRAYASRLVKEGVTCNAVAPMLIHTGEKRDNEARKKLVPLGRQGTAEEVADAIVLCARTEFMTGQTVHMNGGVYYSG